MSKLRAGLAVGAAWLAASTFAAAQSSSAAAPDAVGTPIVIGRSFTITSKVLGDVRRVNVFLPADYATSGARYPVVFLLDGGVGEDFLHISGLAQITSAYGQGREVIVVGIEGKDRRHDLTSPSDVPSDRKLVPTAGGASDYRRFLVDELKPWVAARYRTSGRAALMGESLAGLFTAETLLEHPDAFDDYVIVSPSLWWRDGALAAAAASDLRRAGFAGRRAFIAFDDPPPPASEALKDVGRQTAFRAAFEAAAPADLTWTAVRPGEGHADIYHPAAYLAFRWLYGTPPVPRPN